NEAASGSFIKIADGYIRGAQIYIDTNGNGEADPGVDYYAGDTDAQGNFFLPDSAPKGTIIAVGGVNIDTGVPNDVPLKAPVGSTSVNPLTTLVQAVLEANVGTGAAGQTPEAIDAATQAVASALGITGAGADLTRYDPVAAAATDPSAQKAAAKIATIFALAEGAGAGSGDTVLANLTEQVQAAIENGATVELDDAATLGAMLEGTNTSLAVQSKIADAAKAIGQATSLEGISQAQSQFLDTVAPNAPTGLDLVDASDTGTSATDNLTRLTTAVVRVSLDVSSEDGGAVVAGDQVFLLRDGAKLVDGRTLTALDISRGYVDIDAAGLQNGVNTLVARIVDQSGKASDGAVTPSLQITVDTDAPQAAVLASVGGDDVVNAAEQGSALTGTAEAGARVTLTLAGTATTQTTVTANASGAWTYTLQAADITALGQGSKQLSVVATDAAGNASATATRAFSVDTVAPTAVAAITSVQDDVPPVTGSLASGATSDDQTIALAGTVGALGAGEQVAVYDGTTRLGIATVNAGAGTWTFTTPNLANGAHALSARVEDAAGNAGSSSAAISLTIDTSVPAATALVTGFSVGAVNGNALQGTLTNDATPRVNGALQGALAEGQSVVVYDGAARLGTATVAPGGASWFFDTAGLSEGAHAFSAVVESASGIQGARSASSALRIDTVAPSSPTISVVAGNDVINASEQGSTVTGTAEAGASVTLSLGSETRTIQAGANGAWSYTLVAADITALGQGVDKTISAVATDAAGNASVAPGTRQIVVDTVAPAVAPTVSAVAGNDKINLVERGETQTIQGPAGSAEAGATVELVIGSATYRVAAAANGSWSHTLSSADYAALGQGANLPIVVRSIDAAGNVGASRTHLIEIDTVAPAMSPFTLDPNSDSGTKGDGRSNDTTPTFRVVAEKGVALQVLSGSTVLAATVTDGVDIQDAPGAVDSIERFITLSSPLATTPTTQQYTITLLATDSAGNATLRTGTYTLDTTAPDPATISAVAGDNAVNAAEAAAGVTVRGQAGAYATVELRNQADVTLGSAPLKANASGAWSYTLSAAELQAMGQGVETLSVITRDAADNASTRANRLITIDTQTPAAAPVIATVIDDADGGTFTGALPAANAATNDQTLTLNGTAAGAGEGDLVVVFDGTTRLGEAPIVSGSWTFTTPNLSNAAHSLTARVVDAAGNEGPSSGAFSVTVNAERPTATAAVTGFLVGDTNATPLAGSVTNDTTPMVTGTVTGTLAQGDVIVVYDGAARLVGAVQVTGSTWSFTGETSLTPGAYSFSAVVENSAGTQGTRSAGVALSVDTTPPPAPVINTVAGDNVINVLEQGTSISGTAEAGATVNLTLGSVAKTVQAGANGAWTYTLTSPDLSAMGQGQVTISASARDAAGNASATSATRSITIDTLAPGQPVVNAVAGDGIINAAERAAGVDITGTTDAGTGGRVTVTVAGNSYRVTPGTDGTWTYRLTDADFNALGQGAGKTVVVAATDAAGNTGAPRTGVTFAIDSAAPTLSPLSLLSASDSGTKGDGISNVTTPQLGFTADAGLTFKVKVGSGEFQDVTAAADGSGLKVTMPEGALVEGANTITLQAKDTAGNVVERSIVYTRDIEGAGLSISDDESGVANIAGGSVVYTFNFTQPVTGFTADDITVVGGTTGTFSGISATEYRLTVNPNPGFEGSLSVAVATGAAHDVAGNGSAAAQAAAQAVDTKAPTVAITDDRATTTNGAITYTFTFSEAVTGFTDDDVTVANGTKGTFTAVSGTQYTLVVTPATGFEGAVTVDVAAGAAADAVNNASTAAAQSVQVVDTRAPVFTGATAASYAENGTGVAYTAAATDASGPVHYALSGGADMALFTIDETTGAVRFTASPNFEVRADAGADNV
ncbi:Ig-like domain-containing protein, partial [Gemmatimonas sp.]|uniref:beta strand repeat-containing protein n=1 Tax=Gemmatimonas sp. TaxID=1962908 RepID=UPI0025BE7A7D